MTVPEIITAHRNARVLKWLSNQPIATQDDLRRFYAGSLTCPIDETVWWPDEMDNETLEWVYQNCRNQIDR
jgi:hypothetical protein